MNFPLECSKFPAAPVHGVYISQLIRYSRVCVSYHDFLDGGLLLQRRLLEQWFLYIATCSSKISHVLRTSYDHHHHLETITEYLSHWWPFIIVIITSIFALGLITRVTRQMPLEEQRPLTIQSALRSPPFFSEVSCSGSLDFCVVFCYRPLFVLLPLFVDLGLLITSLVFQSFLCNSKWELYTPYAGAAIMFLYINGKVKCDNWNYFHCIVIY